MAASQDRGQPASTVQKSLARRVAKLATENSTLKTRLAKAKTAVKKPVRKVPNPTSLRIVARAIAAELLRRQDPNHDAQAALDAVAPPHDTLLRYGVQGVRVSGLLHPARWSWAGAFLRQCTLRAWQQRAGTIP